RFRDDLRGEIQRSYPDYAGLSPVILGHLLDMALQRARGYGFTRESTLGQFVYLMAAIAPNFDLHPAIHAGLVNPGIAVDERIDALVNNLPGGVWAEAAEHSSALGWFLTGDAFAAKPETRLAMALSNALPQDLAEPPPALEAKVLSVIGRAKALGFDTEDGQFVFAACQVIYGVGFESRLDWAKDALDPELGRDVQVALLRARIAIDTAAWL
ncbi:MAG: hypothetical protein ACOYMG_23260, partial [Candidatus Methylumidiphilus sp.]